MKGRIKKILFLAETVLLSFLSTDFSYASERAQEEAESIERQLPMAYDARERGYVTSVKDQKSYRICWAYAAASVAESSLIAGHETIDGQLCTNKNTDLSEFYLAYEAFHLRCEPQENTKGDENNYLNVTNNFLQAGMGMESVMFLLAGQNGFALEKDFPSSNLPDDAEQYRQSMDPIDGKWEDTVAQMKDASIIPATDTKAVKQTIMQQGSVAASLYLDHQRKFGYLSTKTWAAYCPTQLSVNHAVAIVGWDDQYSRNNFLVKPKQNGAWLVKNSFGKDWGEEGYFWLSYEDKSLRDIYGLKFATKSENEMLYQYDGSSGKMKRKLSSVKEGEKSVSRVCNRFTIVQDGEKLSGISFAVATENLEYKIQVYKNSTLEDPTSGMELLENPKTGKTSYKGYYTIPLESKISLRRNDTISIVLSLYTTTVNPYIYIENSYATGEISFQNQNQGTYSAGQTENGWKEFSQWDGTIRLKAMTQKRVVAQRKFTPQNVMCRQMEQSIYTGKPIEPEVQLCWKDGTLLQKKKDYLVTLTENVNAGKAKLTAYGIGEYTGRWSTSFRIQPETLENAQVRIEDQIYNGKEKKPEIKVYLHGKKLKYERDYTVKYSANKYVGKGIVQIYGCGNYEGIYTAFFRIKKQETKLNVQKKCQKVYGCKSFYLNMQYKGEGKLYYRSNHPEIAQITKTGEIIVKRPGLTRITIQNTKNSQNYKYIKKQVYLYIQPQQVKWKQISWNEDKLHAEFCPVKYADGYQISYSGAISGKANKIRMVSASNLYVELNRKKEKEYTIRVRAYVKDGERVIYGKWSDKKVVK